jgi:accessory gene regulator B
MGIFAKLSHRIGDNLVRSNVVKEEDAEIYIYGINQILVSVLNVSSALIIGWIFGVLLEIAVFMTAYIPLRTFAGGYHAKTPIRCYIFSVILLIIVSSCMKYIFIAEWVYYAILATAALVVLILAPVEDKNKPLDETEHKVYKRRTMLIAASELAPALLLKLIMFDALFIAIIYSFVVLSLMLVAGKMKNRSFNL